MFSERSKHLGNESSTLRILSDFAGSKNLSKFLCTVIFVGEQHLKCSTRPISFARQAILLIYLFL